MYLSTEFKKDIFAKHGKSATDTGSTEGQVALFSARIAHLTEHLKKNKKDFSTQLSLQKLVGKRRSLLAYLYNKDINRYRAIIKALELRDIIK
ncbi:MAG: 30S ribosomal protein S15 [Pedobacter sp.]|jgi:small subunit ribosomal protein S15|nr:MAG: 30S ribosomal protein S15 [Pedobacter sp.]